MALEHSPTRAAVSCPQKRTVPFFWKFAQPAEALLLEVGVAHGQRLVDDEDVGIDMRDDREGEAHGHAGGVGLDGLVDELADIGEGQDVGEPRLVSSCARPSTLALRKTFCRPVYSGLKPEPSSSRAATRPWTSTSPWVGVSVPQTSWSSVDLPEPLRPMMPTVSPRATSKESSCRAQNSWK
jgi:hypothetical protein